MKRVNLFFIAAFVAASAMFVSCGDPEDGPPELAAPTIQVFFNESPDASLDGKIDRTGDAEDAVKIEIEFTAPGDLAQISITRDGTNGPMPPVVTDFLTPTGHFETWTVVREGNAAYTVKYEVSVLDAQTPPKPASITIEINFEEYVPPRTELGDEESFSLTMRTNNSQTDGDNDETTVGVRYNNNSGDNSGRFLAIPTPNSRFVPLNATQLAGIEDYDDLVEEYDSRVGADGIGEFTRPNGTSSYSFISKVGDNYFLVTMTQLAMAPGNNVASFVYKTAKTAAE